MEEVRYDIKKPSKYCNRDLICMVSHTCSFLSDDLKSNERLAIKFCSEVTNGVNYLHDMNCIPSDLATRCCQIDSNMTVKVLLCQNHALGFFLIHLPSNQLKLALKNEVNLVLTIGWRPWSCSHQPPG